MKPRTVTWLLGAAFAPVFVMSAALCVLRRPSLNGPGWGYAAVAVSIAAGLCCLWRLPSSISILSRTWLTVLYVPVVAGLLLLYSLLFVGVVFGDGP